MKHLIPFIPKSISAVSRCREIAEFVASCPDSSLVLAPELVLGGYSEFYADDGFYDTLFKSCVGDKIIAFTRFTKCKNDKPKNELILLNQSGIIHSQAKSKLFLPNGEDKIFSKGSESGVVPFKFNGINIGALICFELRFLQLWEQLVGADIVLVPAMWGDGKRAQFEALCAGLAVINGAFVLAVSAGDGACEVARVYLPDGTSADRALYDSSLAKNIAKAICKDKNG
ncbi:carbon-nitrogen hydrolase family protein [Campylobacter sp. 19-13652]|uniref:carbon-nitrogen hydrolase family protein n=1 Tax=Campylobacter sp. 19-13652 TaxID=2840180 RepID=UPI001C775D27|nr:carbon-nitrogen hydrolase family protein [Campylobacter sp. 19-13652]BCX78726.1 hypothetical protein LBC_01880 [Campylobacter sp. 19-13652]